MTALSAAVVLLAAALSPAHAAAQRRLFLFGGGDYSRPAMERFARESGGAKAKILIITWNSEDPDEYVNDFKASVAFSSPAAMDVAPSTAAFPARRQEFLDRLAAASAVFFCGGDQNRVSDFLAKNPDIRRALHKRYREGAVFSGMSAGTAIMSEVMITGEGDFSVIDGSKVGTDKGLGLLPGVITDQHFLAKQRENRLFGLVLNHPDLLGVGVDEPAALLVQNDRYAEAVGPGWVMMVAARKPQSLELDLLKSGDRYDLSARKRL